ncbi:hypothetical protein B0G84_7717 [Paraburkholderia sp. BL8N3]|nr:hypothetical protein [Paraburkholderia sp. BL8N3]TCK33478.1 hypothetical protein B0G84_7717 [Paraburkholderia sp. BL8N3]
MPGNDTPVTREEFDALKRSLFGTWVAIGHVLAETHGKQKALSILSAAEDSAHASELLPVFHLAYEALVYMRQAAENKIQR